MTEQHRKTFCDWLTACGAEVLEPIEPEERIRVVIDGLTYSMYEREDQRQHWPSDLRRLFRIFYDGVYYPSFARAPGGRARTMQTDRYARMATIAKRDGGWECWYCGWPLQPRPSNIIIIGARLATVEELCPQLFGGPQHIGNQVLACHDCNRDVSALNVSAKVLIRETRRKTKRFSPILGWVPVKIRAVLAEPDPKTSPSLMHDGEISLSIAVSTLSVFSQNASLQSIYERAIDKERLAEIERTP